MTDDKVKERIRALLNTANNAAATDGEIETALRFAKSMMRKHHLSEDDIVERVEDELTSADFARYRVVIGKKFFKWELDLAYFAKEMVGGVNRYRDSTMHAKRAIGNRLTEWDKHGNNIMGKSIVFYGVDDDALTAALLYQEMRLTIITLAKMKWGGCYKGDGGTYAEGFVSGLITKLRKDENEEVKFLKGTVPTDPKHALIVQRNELIATKERMADEWLETENGIKLVAGQGLTGANGSGAAWVQGREDGSASDVNVRRRSRAKRLGVK